MGSGPALSTFISSFIDKKQLACILIIISFVDYKHIFGPIFSDHCPQDAANKNVILVGNSVKELAICSPVEVVSQG